MKEIFLTMALCVVVIFYGCYEESQGLVNKSYPVKIILTHKSGGELLQLGKEIINPHGEPLSISAFAYYISNFSLTDANGRKIVLPVEYFLVDERSVNSKTITIKAPVGNYQSIEWLIGVDSIRNVSGVQTGALDPANGMFWSWNTGYIFAKMEGKSSVSTAPMQNIIYHIGGFRQMESALQKVTLVLPQMLRVTESVSPSVEIEANTDAWFKGVNNIRIVESAFTMTPGLLAQHISQNYARMFSVISVNN